MTFAQRKQLVLAAWVATIAIIGVVFTIDTPHLWIAVAAVALGPSATAHWLWNAPEESVSQLIASVRSRT